MTLAYNNILTFASKLDLHHLSDLFFRESDGECWFRCTGDRLTGLREAKDVMREYKADHTSVDRH